MHVRHRKRHRAMITDAHTTPLLQMSSNDDVPSLGRLDAYQKIVATADPAACITVHSCAGSGKSSTLAMRARVLCEAGVPTHRILLLTFSNRSCDDLTAKLAKVAPAVSCRTHHAHALALLRASGHPQASAAVVEPREQRAIIKEALARHAPSQEKPTSKIVRKLLASFAKAKSTGLPQDLPHSVTDRRCFEDYQELLRQRNQACKHVPYARSRFLSVPVPAPCLRPVYYYLCEHLRACAVLDRFRGHGGVGDRGSARPPHAAAALAYPG